MANKLSLIVVAMSAIATFAYQTAGLELGTATSKSTTSGTTSRSVQAADSSSTWIRRHPSAKLECPARECRSRQHFTRLDDDASLILRVPDMEMRRFVVIARHEDHKPLKGAQPWQISFLNGPDGHSGFASHRSHRHHG